MYMCIATKGLAGPLPLQEESEATGNGDTGEDASLLQQSWSFLRWKLKH